MSNRPMRPSRGLATLTAALALAACSEDPTGCDLCTTSATVRGRVETAAGNAVPQAGVAVVVYMGATCAGTTLPVFDIATGNPPRNLVTDADGRFSIRLRTHAGPATRCVAISAAPPGGGTESSIERQVAFADDWPKLSSSEAVVTIRLAP